MNDLMRVTRYNYDKVTDVRLCARHCVSFCILISLKLIRQLFWCIFTVHF